MLIRLKVARATHHDEMGENTRLPECVPRNNKQPSDNRENNNIFIDTAPRRCKKKVTYFLQHGKHGRDTFVYCILCRKQKKNAQNYKKKTRSKVPPFPFTSGAVSRVIPPIATSGTSTSALHALTNTAPLGENATSLERVSNTGPREI